MRCRERDDRLQWYTIGTRATYERSATTLTLPKGTEGLDGTVTTRKTTDSKSRECNRAETSRVRQRMIGNNDTDSRCVFRNSKFDTSSSVKPYKSIMTTIRFDKNNKVDETRENQCYRQNQTKSKPTGLQFTTYMQIRGIVIKRVCSDTEAC